MNSTETVANFRQKRKLLLVQLSGGKCSLCGYDRCLAALEFHHIDPTTKEYQLSSGNCHSLEKDIEELHKCLLVCANCHREIHQENSLYSQEYLTSKQIFDTVKYNEILDKKTYCLDCGKEISSKNQSHRCIDCYRIFAANKKKPSREELKNLIRTISFTKIGEMYNVTNNAVVKWCQKENLPFRKKDISQYSDEEWFKI